MGRPVIAAQAAEILDALARSAWLLPLVFVLCAADGVLPVVPGETAVIILGAFAASGHLDLPVVLVVVAVASFVGDCVCFLIWRRLAAKRSARGRPATRCDALLGRVGQLLRGRGGQVILAARFIPSGRTAASVAAAVSGYPASSFVRWDAAASAAWAVYGTMIGYVGGHVAGRNPLYGVLVGLSCGLLATVVLSLVHRRGGCANPPPVRPAGPPRPVRATVGAPR